MRRSLHAPTVISAAFAGLAAVLPARLEARGGWQDIPFTYAYEANAGEDAYSNAFNTLGCLDGQWRRSSNSDQWDGSTPEPGDGAPGGIEIVALPGEGDGGGDASVLSLEDVGDPRGAGFPDPGNRKLYLWRDTTAELDLARGVTLVARWRLNPEPRSAEFSTNGGALPVPNGTHLHDQNKGQVGFVQKTPASGTVAATLSLAITDAGTLQFAGPFNNTPCTGVFFPDELCLDVDESGWVSVWMSALEDAGGIQFRLYLNGERDPAVDTVLTGIRADAETATLPEGGGAASSYIEVALGATPQDGAIQVDFVSVADGAFDPPEEASPCPGAARARAQGRSIVLEWTNGAVVPSSVDVLRDGVQIAAGTPADPPAYTDAAVDPGAHAYVIRPNVPGRACEALQTAIDTCPKGLTAAPTSAGVLLAWTNTGEYAGLSVSRDDVAIEPGLAGTAASYLDAAAAPGKHVYSVAPTAGACAPAQATINYFRPPGGAGDFSAEPTEWTYSLDPPAGADRAAYLAHNPVPNEPGDLDGAWSSGNGSDSWDGSAPGEIGDPALDAAGVEDPASAAPGGIGLVKDGDVGAYLFEDTGDPRGTGYQDPSNRKLYLCYDAIQSVPEANSRSLISDGVTLRARFRLTPKDRAVDVSSAPDGYPTNNDGKGMFSIVHDAAVTLAGASQRIAVALDLNPAEPGAGLLFVGDEAAELAVPVPDPTAWLDLWLVAEDPDPLTPEVDLRLFLNGSTAPVIDVADFLPAPEGGEGGAAQPPGNVLYMGLNVTADSGSMEVDLVCLLDGARDPEEVVKPPTFHRGDADGNGVLQLTDAIRILGFLFLGAGAPPCMDAADADDNEALQLTDAIRILGFLFLGGPPPAAPGPPPAACGPDAPAGDALGCGDYGSC